MPAASAFTSLVDLLAHRAFAQPGDRAYAFLSDRGREEASLTFSDLDRRARTIARQLAGQAQKGDRAALVFPPGLDFLVAFFACLYLGVIAVPMMTPRRARSQDASNAILADCSPRLAITNHSLARARPDVIDRWQGTNFRWFILDSTEDASAADLPAPKLDRDDIAFLQYTSGSTSSPKGVIVSHGNLLENLEMIRLALGNTRTSTFVSWMPLYHDMGLILNALETLYVGALCVLLAPVSFMQRPMMWLRAIAGYRAEVGCAPNFAFDVCVDRFRAEQMHEVELSTWKIALNGAEPVRAETLARFSDVFARYGFNPQAFYPAYGLAEATLLVSGGRRSAGPITRPVSRAALKRDQVAPPAEDQDSTRIVGCGRSLRGERLAIINPDRCERLEPDRIGEIWVHGPNVTQGYWQHADATVSRFGARIAGEGDTRWLRTGDLGFLDHHGDLYVTGRIKDVIIVRGMNHYPQDIENTMQNSHPALRRHCGAAFTIAAENGEEILVLVQEVERTQRHELECALITGSIREAVVEAHELAVANIVLISPGAIPKTTSGKIQRNLTRQLWLAGLLQPLN